MNKNRLYIQTLNWDLNKIKGVDGLFSFSTFSTSVLKSQDQISYSNINSEISNNESTISYNDNADKAYNYYYQMNVDFEKNLNEVELNNYYDNFYY